MDGSSRARTARFWARTALRALVAPGRAFRWVRRHVATENDWRARLPDHAAAAGESFSRRFAKVPEHLVQKVNARRDESLFLKVGRTAAHLVAETCGPLAEGGQVLDFGCGLGRVLMALKDLWPAARFTAFDVDPLMLEWGRYLLAGPEVAFIGTTTPLRDGRFDLVYAVSVFTHLNETADYWLAEIHRLLKPSGKAFLTFLDPTLFQEWRGSPNLPGSTKDTPLGECYVRGAATPEGGIAMGTFFSTDAWERKLARCFHVERTEPRGLHGLQSFSVVRPREARPDCHEAQRRHIHHLERELRSLRLRTRELF